MRAKYRNKKINKKTEIQFKNQQRGGNTGEKEIINNEINETKKKGEGKVG
jgi:hypothetical protein